ncbi:hypothetical protein K445DRAFT_22083 [Daldinia sp. EC12]|nr:hypothetical protein K445DRAFT_22083 [Daldinia sp. EC12]
MVKSGPKDGTTVFIVNTPARQLVEENRRTIRSHVMRGKNRKRLPSKPSSWVNGGQLMRVNTPIPLKVGGELSLTALSNEISPILFETIGKLKDAMQPLELNILPSYMDDSWFEPICNDTACLHFTIYIAIMYQNFVQGQKGTDPIALTHFIKALALLRDRLARCEYDLSTSNSTILAVSGLIMVATAMEDLEAALRHIEGLCKIVTLRGARLASLKH